MVIASLFPYLQSIPMEGLGKIGGSLFGGWGLSDYECGWLATIVTLMMTVFVFPISFIVDRWSRKKSIGIMAILWSIAAAGCAFTRNFKQLLSLRSVIGVGEAAYTPGVMPLSQPISLRKNGQQ